MKITYKRSFYSEIMLPAYTGLLERVLNYNFTVKKHETLKVLEVGVDYLLSELPGGKTFEFVKSQSNYELTNGDIVTMIDLFNVVLNATNNLRLFLQQFENIDTHLKEVENRSPELLRDRLLPVLMELNG